MQNLTCCCCCCCWILAAAFCCFSSSVTSGWIESSAKESIWSVVRYRWAGRKAHGNNDAQVFQEFRHGDIVHVLHARAGVCFICFSLLLGVKADFMHQRLKRFLCEDGLPAGRAVQPWTIEPSGLTQGVRAGRKCRLFFRRLPLICCNLRKLEENTSQPI